jgi:Septum formation
MPSPARGADKPTGPSGGSARPAPGPARHRRAVTIGLVALLVVAIIGAAAGITAWLTHGFRNQSTVRYHPAAVFSVRAGDCINLTPNGTAVHVVPCASAHTAEVFGTFRLAGGTWPGTAAVGRKAASGCSSRLAGYLNPQLAATNLTQSYVYPGQQAWDTGERSVVCEVRATSGTLTGSVRSGV